MKGWGQAAAHRLLGAVLVAAAVSLATPGTGLAADRVVTFRGTNGPGPARYDRVRVVEQGPAAARNVLVLMPGTSAGAAYFRPLGASLARLLPGWQVWSVDRRENLLEDHVMLDRALAGSASPQALFDYYVGWLGTNGAGAHIAPPGDDRVAFARRWGMKVTVEDLRRVIRRAAAKGGRVVLGGHSLGGTITTAYATWDFNGRPGVADLDGLVFIDGGGTYPDRPSTPAAVRKELASIQTGSPFLDLVGQGVPWAGGVFAAVGSTLARIAPDAPSMVATSPLVPAILRPPIRVTNAAEWGYGVDPKTGPKSLALVQHHVGELRPDGDPRGWNEDALVPLKRSVEAFSGIPGIDGTSWYHPRRLTLDSWSVNGGIRKSTTRLLGLRTTHGRDLHVPIYAFETGGLNSSGRVLAGARALARQSGVPKRDLTLVRRASYAHVDPVVAPPPRSAFISTLVPFLRHISTDPASNRARRAPKGDPR